MVSYSVEFDIGTATIGNNPSQAFSASIPFFSSDLGTLRQVDLRYNFDLELGISISNRTLNPLPITLSSNGILINGQRFFDRFSSSNIVGSATIPETLINVPAGTSRTFGSITLILPGRSSNIFDLESSFLRTSRPLIIRDIVLRTQGNVAPFIGSGDKLFEFSAYTQNSLNLPNSGSVLSGVTSNTMFNIQGSVDITYEYEPAVVPIPLTLPLLLSGIIGLIYIARSK